jgi:hypothetical protein
MGAHQDDQKRRNWCERAGARDSVRGCPQRGQSNFVSWFVSQPALRTRGNCCRSLPRAGKHDALKTEEHAGLMGISDSLWPSLSPSLLELLRQRSRVRVSPSPPIFSKHLQQTQKKICVRPGPSHWLKASLSLNSRPRLLPRVFKDSEPKDYVGRMDECDTARKFESLVGRLAPLTSPYRRYPACSFSPCSSLCPCIHYNRRRVQRFLLLRLNRRKALRYPRLRVVLVLRK